MRDRYSSIDFALVRDVAAAEAPEASVAIADDRSDISLGTFPKVSNCTESKKESISLMIWIVSPDIVQANTQSKVKE